MVVTLESMIKRIRMNGGKVAPLVADAFDKFNTELKLIRGEMQGSKDHKILWDAITNCHHAANDLQELRNVNKANGFVTIDQLEKATTYSFWDTVIYFTLPIIIGFGAGYVGALVRGM